MRIRIFGFSSDINKPPSPGGLMTSVLACIMLGGILFQQITSPKREVLSILLLAAAFLSACYHLFYQLKGLHRQKKAQSYDAEFMHRNERISYETPRKEENFYCPYCGRAVEDAYEFCNTCGKKLP